MCKITPFNVLNSRDVTMSERRGRKLKAPTQKTLQNARPNSARAETCSDRIIQLALPNIHIVSSVLKDHFKTLSQDHVGRLEKLLNEIKTSRASISQMNFLDDLKDFKESDKRKIINVLEGAHTKKPVKQNQCEWTKLRLLPVKSSSDTFLIGLEKKQELLSSRNSFIKSEKSSNNSSNEETYNGMFRKAIAAMNFNYRDAVYMQFDGLKSNINLISQSIQTDEYKVDVCQACKKGKDEKQARCKRKVKPKPRQLHTLLDNNEFLRNSVNNKYNTINYSSYIEESIKKKYETIDYNSYIEKSQRAVFFKEDVQLTIKHLRVFYMAAMVNINFLLHLPLDCSLYLCKALTGLVIYFSSLFTFHYCSFVYTECKIVKSFFGILKRISSIEIPFVNTKSDSEIVVERKPKKKKKHIITKGYQFSNVPSIVH